MAEKRNINDKFYTCESTFSCDIIRYGKHWSVTLIWQHSCGQLQCGGLRFCDDGVVRLEYGKHLTNTLCCFFTYIQSYYGSCYAKNKSQIYEFFF